MRKLIALLAIMLMACPAVVAVGATYVDTFDNAAYPDQSWVFQDEAAHTEAWIGGVGQAQNAPNYNVGFGGTCTMDAATIPPTNVFGLVSTFDGSNFTPIAYTGGSLTVSGVLNADGSTTATNDSALIGFMMDTDSSGFNEAYMMMISPTWHFTAIYSLEEVGHPTNQTAIRLRVTDLDGGPGHVPTPSDPLMDMPVDCTMQIETISSGPNAGNIRISAISYADYHGTGVEKISEMSFIVGVDTPSSSGHDPPGSYGPGDVPKIFGGATGFAGIVTVDVPTPLDTSIDDYTARDSLPGDFDLNGSVDVSDLGILATNYDTLTGATVFLGDGDFNGTVDVSDLGILATNYGQDVWTAAAAVPEPGTLMLLGLGTLTLLIRRNRR